MKYFTYTEFDSPDEVGSGKKMHPKLLVMLDMVRDKFDKPIHITSGYRTVEHNARVGGTENSSHLKGMAVDIACADSVTRQKIVSGLIKAGFTRIGISKTFIHADNDTKTDAIWLY